MSEAQIIIIGTRVVMSYVERIIFSNFQITQGIFKLTNGFHYKALVGVDGTHFLIAHAIYKDKEQF